MTPRWSVILGVGLLLAADNSKQDVKKDQKALQGTWIAKSIQYDGDEVLGDTVKEIRLVIAGDKITVKGDGPDVDQYARFTYKLDPSTTPKTIDVTITAGDKKGTALEGIYHLKGDELKWCVKLIGKERPVKFKTEADSQTVLATFKRQKR